MDEVDDMFTGMAPYLYYEDAAGMLDWLVANFGFIEDVRYVNERGEVAEAELLVGPARVMIGGGHAPRGDQGRGQLLVVYVKDVDAHHEQVRSAGLAPEEPTDMPYGARVYSVTDPGGYRWTFWQPHGEMELPEGWDQIHNPHAGGITR